MEWFDSFAQWMVNAPIAVQMLILVATAVPAMVVLAWVLMWAVDAVARLGARIYSHEQ
ncbi:hypothetical protein [Corynebacterium phocae]|nr:hypothetical protein [Corynebacterium phocae]